MSGLMRVSIRHLPNPIRHVTTPGGTASAFAATVGIVTVDIATGDGVAALALELHPKGAAAGATAFGAAGAHGAATGAAAGGVGVEQHPVMPSAATRARMHFIPGILPLSGPGGQEDGYLAWLGIDEIRRRGYVPDMADERTTPINPKWGPLPESLSDKVGKKKPCEGCGMLTVGSQGAPQTRLALDGSIHPAPKHLCWDCEPRGARSILARQKELERKNESYRSHR